MSQALPVGDNEPLEPLWGSNLAVFHSKLLVTATSFAYGNVALTVRLACSDVATVEQLYAWRVAPKGCRSI